MFKRMDYYIAQTVLVTVLVVFLCATALTAIFTLVDEADGVTESFTFLDVLLVVLLTTPARTVDAMPFIVFLGALIGLGRLSSQSEITVFRSAGVSIYRLFASTTLAVFVFLLTSLAISEFVVPITELQAASIRKQASGDRGDVVLNRPYWYREGKTFTSIRGIERSGALRDIQQFELDEANELKVTRYSHRASFDEDNSLWRMEAIQETRFDNRTAVSRTIKHLNWKTKDDPTTVGARVLVSPNKLSIMELAYQIDYLRSEELNSSRYEVAFWTKLLQPISILGLILIALGSVVGPLREVGMGARVAAGIAIGIVFRYFQELAGPLSLLYEFPVPFGVGIPTLATWLVGIYFVYRSG